MSIALTADHLFPFQSGAFGYLAFTDRTEDVITLNLPDGILATIVKIGLMIALLLVSEIVIFAF